MLGQETVVKITVHFSITGMTEKMFKLKLQEEIVEQAKKYVPRRTVTVKKAGVKIETPPAEARENDPDSDPGEEGEKIYSFIMIY